MSIIYVASIGQSAALHRQYWHDAKARFEYTESVIICGKNLVDEASRFLDANANLVIIEHPFHGTEGYIAAIKDIVKQVMSIVKFYEKKGQEVDEIVVNTAGGTEKMSCIIKDALDVIRQLFPYVTHVWGALDGYSTLYTVKPKVDLDEFVEQMTPKPPMPSISVPISIKTYSEVSSVIIEPTVFQKKRKRKIKPKIDPVIQQTKEAIEQRKRQEKLIKYRQMEAKRQEKHQRYLKSLEQNKLGNKIINGVKSVVNTIGDALGCNEDNEVKKAI